MGKRKTRRKSSSSDSDTDSVRHHKYFKNGGGESSISDIISEAHNVIYESDTCSNDNINNSDMSIPNPADNKTSKKDTMATGASNTTTDSEKLDKLLDIVSDLKLSQSSMKVMFERRLDELKRDLMGNIDNKIDSLKNKLVTDIGKESRRVDEILNTVQQLTTRVGQVEQTATAVGTTTIHSNVCKAHEELKATVIDMQCRSMKNNLIFRGIHEISDENTEYRLRNFINDMMEIPKYLEFGNVHRFGKRQGRKPRPIVARFLYHDELVMVKNAGSTLRNTNFSVNEQFPPEIEQKRQKLYPVASHYRRSGHSTKLVRDKLFIDGQLYTSENDTNNGNHDMTRGNDQRTYSDVARSNTHVNNERTANPDMEQSPPRDNNGSGTNQHVRPG